jgi:L-seryl-tRNA(Ser) seleniumtransferase
MQTSQAGEMAAACGRPLALEAIRSVLNDARAAFQEAKKLPNEKEILAQAQSRLSQWTAPSLVPVINATGVVLHTNLGRASISRAAADAARKAAISYSNLEYDLGKGQRGSRLVHAEDVLKRLLGVEAALVVNNNAAAVLLALSTLAKRRGVVIARSQLVEIGGGFRVPDVMKQSGARLVEIGATNRVHLSDYQQALEDPSIALVMRAHRSNFQIIGFTSEPSLTEIASAAHTAGVPLVDDLGSGALIDTSKYGMAHEPTVQESLEAGADLVCFSGDKLLGGPQAGIIVGKAELVAKLRKHPLARAVRADKLCLAALTATLLHYLKDEAEREIPIWRMIAASLEELEKRACRWKDALGQGEVIDSLSAVGGGSLPGETIKTRLLSLKVKSPNTFLNRLREQDPPVIARLEDDRVVFDPRTVQPDEEEALVRGILNTLTGEQNHL